MSSSSRLISSMRLPDALLDPLGVFTQGLRLSLLVALQRTGEVVGDVFGSSGEVGREVVGDTGPTVQRRIGVVGRLVRYGRA